MLCHCTAQLCILPCQNLPQQQCSCHVCLLRPSLWVSLSKYDSGRLSLCNVLLIVCSGAFNSPESLQVSVAGYDLDCHCLQDLPKLLRAAGEKAQAGILEFDSSQQEDCRLPEQLVGCCLEASEDLPRNSEGPVCSPLPAQPATCRRTSERSKLIPTGV